MKVSYHREFSPALGRDMEYKVYGSAGRPVLVFPTSKGRFFQYEDSGMVAVLEDWIDQGLLRLWTVDGIDEETFFADHGTLAVKIARHEQYFRHVHEILLRIRDESRGPGTESPPILLTGCSMGAFHAANFFFRFPQGLAGVLALSGVYSTRQFFGDDCLGDVFFNSPLHSLPGLTDQVYLQAFRSAWLVFCCGQGAWEDEMLDETRRLQQVLGALGVPAKFDYWGTDVNHDWPWWQKQVRYFLGQWLTPALPPGPGPTKA